MNRETWFEHAVISRLFLMEQAQFEHNQHLYRLEARMAGLKENLDAIDKATNAIAEDIGTVKVIIEKLQAGQTDPALIAQAEEAVKKLEAAEADLRNVGTTPL